MSGTTIAPIIFHMQSDLVYAHSLQGRIQDFGKRGGGRGAWGVGDKLAVRASQVCAPGGSEGMPPKNF